MGSKKFPAIALCVSLALGLQLSTFYVPEGFESPAKFRIEAFIMKLGGLYVNLPQI
jgi:hypothetical protein